MDEGGPAVAAEIARSFPDSVILRATVPDEEYRILEQLKRWVAQKIDMIVTTGGTGVAPSDRTPEAVRKVLDIEIPGLAEKMRIETGKNFPSAFLSRQVAGVAQETLLLTLPGSPRGAADCWCAVATLLPHALHLVRGSAGPHPEPA